MKTHSPTPLRTTWRHPSEKRQRDEAELTGLQRKAAEGDADATRTLEELEQRKELAKERLRKQQREWVRKKREQQR